ncbi:MAG: NAD(P)-binding domain-containing protein [Neomegalonema sp.]|nr:NAD(P)-binding domain-containing protein [Neomegalonema sp.]
MPVSAQPTGVVVKPDLRLGLIGANIAQSRSPELHRAAGRQCELAVEYGLYVPNELGASFDDTLRDCAAKGLRGVNVTYPYKERAAELVSIDDPLVRGVGAVNTVLFQAGAAVGFNTDLSGFVAAYRSARGDAPPGVVLLIGAGGVGRAVAFGLAALGAESIRIADRNQAKAQGLADDLHAHAPLKEVSVWSSVEAAADGAAGVINCTPVGMAGYEGTPAPRAAIIGAQWAFDAVYTPPDTQFLQDAEAEGLQTISGEALFFFQGVQAWRLFSGLDVDGAALKEALKL